jgi:predicted nucleotidyltransferase
MLAAGADPGQLIGELGDGLLAAFPGEIRSVYLLGSRALGAETAGSDVDLAIIFSGDAPADRRRAAAQWAEAKGRERGVMVDASVLDGRELGRGIRPALRIGRLLAGPDLLRGLPLRPAPELVAYYAHLAAYFIWAIRGRPAALGHPLDYPAPGEIYGGYERNGVRTGDNQYAPGCAMLVNTVVSLANFRLARLAGEFVPNKSLTVAAYRHLLPDDPWREVVVGVYELGRSRGGGRLPETPADRDRLAACCRQVLAMENEGLGACLLLLPRIAELEDEELRGRMRGIVARASSTSPPHAAALAAAAARL